MQEDFETRTDKFLSELTELTRKYCVHIDNDGEIMDLPNPTEFKGYEVEEDIDGLFYISTVE